jgi:GTP-binding protein
VVIDAPGYGFALGNKSELKAWGAMINKYFDLSLFLHRIILLIDSQHLLKDVDFMLMDLLEKK